MNGFYFMPKSVKSAVEICNAKVIERIGQPMPPVEDSDFYRYFMGLLPAPIDETRWSLSARSHAWRMENLRRRVDEVQNLPERDTERMATLTIAGLVGIVQLHEVPFVVPKA